MSGRHRSGPRTQFLLECLHDVDGSLRELGSRLVDPPRARRNASLRRWPASSAPVRSTSTADVGPYARRRDAGGRDALRETGCELVLHPGLFVVDDPAAIRTGDGGPYTVFTPYHRAWSHAPRREVLRQAPRAAAAPRRSCGHGRIPSLDALGLEQEVSDPAPGGERAGRGLLSSFLADRVDHYREQHDTLADSRHLGAVAATCTSAACRRARSRSGCPTAASGAAELRRQLCWRDFYAQVLRSLPRNARSEHQEPLPGDALEPRRAADFDAWCEGRTGYPVVDAAMRQLRREGWMHNRGTADRRARF